MAVAQIGPWHAFFAPNHRDNPSGKRGQRPRRRTRSGGIGRPDLNVTPVWRSESALGGAARGYVEAGLGVYLLSHTIHNQTNRLPTSLEFGSHLGIGLRLGPDATVGLAVQHISNAGIKQPNGGINLYMLTASHRF